MGQVSASSGLLAAAAAAAVTELPMPTVTASAVVGLDGGHARYAGVMLRESRAVVAGYRAGLLERPRSVCSGGTRTISRDETWAPSAASAYLIGCQLVIGRGATLRIDPGTVVKVGPGGGGGGGGQALYVAPGGSLEAAGTAAHPVVFADGSSVLIAGEGSLVIEHGVFWGDASYAIREVGCATFGGGETVTLKDSVFGGQVDLGSCDGTGGDHFTIERNDFKVPVGITALSVVVPDLHRPADAGRLLAASNSFDPAADVAAYPVPSPPAPEVSISGWPVQGFALSGATSNRFSGSGPGRVVTVTFDKIPAGASWTVSPSNGAVLDPRSDYYSNPGLVVDGGLILEAGLTVKVGDGFASFGGIGRGYGIDLGSGGTLIALGTSARPITFTSMNDSSIGGDSSGTKAQPTQNDYIWAVQADEGSSVNVSHAAFRDGWYAFTDECSQTPKPNGRFSLTHSLVDDEISLGDCDGSQNGYVAKLENNTFGVGFNGAASGNFAAGGGYDPAALQPALLLYNIDPSFIALSGPTSNIFAGSGAGRVVALAGTTIPAGESWLVSAASRAVLAPWQDTDYLKSPGITLSGTLDLGPGTIIKSAFAGAGIDVATSGTLDAAGTSLSPVIFTAISDDKVAGDSNGDHSASKPKPGAYGQAIQFEHIAGDNNTIAHTVFEYASAAISIKYLDYNLKILDSDWAQNVDAIDVEETSGPDYSSLGNLECVPPWLAQVSVEHNWFAPHGRPAPNIDLGSLVGVALPAKIPGSSVAYNASGVAGMISSEAPLFGLGDTVPWAIYSCLKLTAPVTAVAVADKPSAPNFPAIDPT